MRFTMARPEISCHPERLLEGARSVISAALCYYEPGPDLREDEGRLPRYTWRDGYADLRVRLEELGRRLGGSYRVLVDSNDHVDREAAVRAGVGFYGKNTMVITPSHGSWVVLGTLVSDVEVDSTEPLELDCGSCRLCVDACPTAALDEPGVLDATRCLSYWTQAPEQIPEEYRVELDEMVYGCDVCQDVCPWNHGVERRLDGALGRCGARDLASRLARARWRRACCGVRPALRSEERSALAAAECTHRGGQRGHGRDRACGRRVCERRRSGSCRGRSVGARPDPRALVTARADRELLALLVHEVRSSVAALSAIAEAVSSGSSTTRRFAPRRAERLGLSRDRARRSKTLHLEVFVSKVDVGR